MGRLVAMPIRYLPSASRSDQAQTLFADLQRRQPGRFQDGQLRTLQRRVKRWRALAGRPKEVFFEQRYEPGALGQSTRQPTMRRANTSMTKAT